MDKKELALVLEKIASQYQKESDVRDGEAYQLGWARSLARQAAKHIKLAYGTPMGNYGGGAEDYLSDLYNMRAGTPPTHNVPNGIPGNSGVSHVPQVPKGPKKPMFTKIKDFVKGNKLLTAGLLGAGYLGYKTFNKLTEAPPTEFPQYKTTHTPYYPEYT